jgi:hypothetical protein
VSAEFPSFDDYWQPFLRSQGPAFAYIETLTPSRLGRLEEALRDALPIAGDGSFALSLRAWAAKGIN